MSAISVVVEQCYCGRPLRHIGRHIGSGSFPSKKAGSQKNSLVSAVERELQSVHADISRLKREIRDRQNALLDAELKLKPLTTLLDAYQNKRIEGPAGSSLRAVNPLPPESDRSVVDDDDTTFEAVEVDFAQVLKWASVRSLKFKTWDDLPAINRRREEFELPLFKKKL